MKFIRVLTEEEMKDVNKAITSLSGLSWAAIGLLFSVMTLPENRTTTTSKVVNRFKCRKTTRKVLQELTDFGVLKTKQIEGQHFHVIGCSKSTVLKFTKNGDPRGRAHIRVLPTRIMRLRPYLFPTTSNVIKKEGGSVRGGWLLEPHFASDQKFVETWRDWCKYRKKVLKKPMSLVAIKRMLKKLQKYTPPQATQLLDIAMENEWRGIYETKEFKESISQLGNRVPTKTGKYAKAISREVVL